MLTVPAPTIATSAPLSQPLKVAVSGLKFSDGSAVAVGQAGTVGIFVFRGSAGSAEFWDDAQKTWRASPSEDELKTLTPLVAVAKSDGSAQWEATLVGIGQKDGAGADVYSVADNGSPTYFVRAMAKATQSDAEDVGQEDVGLSSPSGTFTFTDTSANNRFATQFDTPSTKPDAAHKVRMFLKGDSQQTAGYLEIRAQPNFEVEIANCDASGTVLAKVLLQSSGDIHLTPATGSRVVIDGDAETNRIYYTPVGGGAKQWLV